MAPAIALLMGLMLTTSQPVLVLETCQQRLLAGDYLAASSCYRELAGTEIDPERQRAAAALAGLAADMAPGAQRPASQPDSRPASPAQTQSKAGIAVVDYVTSGRAEFVAWSGAFGLWLGGLGAASTVLVMQTGSFDSPASMFFVSGALLLPVVGGVVGLTAASIASVTLPDLSAGDVNLLRVAMLAGALNSISAMFLLNGMGVQFNSYDYGDGPNLPPQFAPLVMAGISGVPVFMALAAIPFVDLPDGGPALASSCGIWSSAIALLAMGALQIPSDQWSMAIGMTGLGADALALVALGVSTQLTVARPDTWALDLGALLGLGVGAALAFGVGAPNPLLGYGAMAGGILLGGAAGFTAAFLARRLLEGMTLPQLPTLPDLVAVAPLLAPGDGRPGSRPLVGMTLGFAF